jgi:WD40 repeat protein
LFYVNLGSACRLILGGFGRVFRAVVSDPSAILVFTTWNHQNRRSTIQTYELNEDKKEDCSHLSSRIDGNTQSSDKTIIMFEGDSKDGVSSLAVSKSKMPFICSGHYDFFIRVWDLIERKLMFTLKGHTDWVVSVAVWKGSERLAVSGSSDGTIKIWDLRTGDIVTTCEGHLRDVWSVTVTEGPKPLIVSASVDKTIRTWDINPFLNDLKWERRRNFCTFVYCCGLLDRIISKNVSISKDLQDKNEGSNVHCIEYSSELMYDKSNKHDKGIADRGVMIDVTNPSDTSNLKIEKVSASHCVAKSNPQSDNVNHNIVISDYLTEMKKLDITKVTDTVEKRDDMFDMNDTEFTYKNEFDCNKCTEIQYKKTCSDNSPSIASVLSEVSPKSFLEMVFQSIHLCTEIASYI